MQKKTIRFGLAAGAFLVAALSLFAVSGGQAGVVHSPHDFSGGTSGTGLSTKSAAVAQAGVCSACHIPHNAADNVLWPRTLTGINNYSTLLTLDGNPTGELNYRPGYTLQCYDCHDYHFSGGIDDNPAFNNFQPSHKPQDIAFGFQIKLRDSSITTDSGSTMMEDPPAGSYSGYYENAPPYASNPYGVNPALASRTDNTALAKTGGHYFKSGDPNISKGIYKGDKLPCSDCHDPHKWRTGTEWQAFFSPLIQTSKPGQWTSVFGSVPATSTVKASSFMANPLEASTGMTRDNNASRNLCIVCHGNSSDSAVPKSPVAFSDVNPNYGNPLPTIVRPPAGINEHTSSSTVACVSCHIHNMIDASCSMCHGFPPSDNSAVPYPSPFIPVPTPGANVDSHARHVGNKQGLAKNTSGPYALACGVCHYGSAMGFDTGLGHHQNNRVSVVLQGIWTKAPNGGGGLWDNTNYYNQGQTGVTGQLDSTNGVNGWGAGARYGGNTCKNVYCHSAGRIQTSMTLDCTVDYPRPVWLSGPVHCNDCHGQGTTVTPDPTYGTINLGMPSYANGGVASGKANSHGPHVIKNGIECTTCHFNTVTGTGATRAIKGVTSTPHVNLQRNVDFDTAVVTGSPTYDNVTQTCSVSCHGGGSPRWGMTTLTCFSCHAGTEAVAKPQPNQGIPSPVDNAQYLSSGHGRTAASGVYPPSADGNPPAHFDNVAGSPSDCFVCHSMLSRHIGRTNADITNDPYRLGTSTVAGKPGGLGTFTGNFADNVDTLCLGCHGNSTQRAGHNGPTDNAAKGTRTIDAQTHAWGITGKKYNAGSSAWPVSSWKCVDCHDPHGDANLKMVRSAINAPTSTSDTNAGSDGKGTPKRTTGLDNVLFTNVTGQFAGSYASLPAKGQGVCEICHTNPSLTLYNSAGAGNTGSHATRTGRCATCHVHTAGFKGLGGPDLGQYFDRSFQAPGPTNFGDNSSHPLRGMTTADNTLRFAGTENCLACHYSSGTGHTSDECVMCHFEDQVNAPAGNHMDGTLQMAAITGNTLPTSAYTIATLADYDAWCLQCHGTTTISLGGRFPSAAAGTLIDAAQFAGGRHRGNTVGCIFCHQPHGSGNAQILRTNPANRMAAGGTVKRFNVYPADNTGSYGTPANQAIWYRARVDNVSPNVFADADDETNFCNRACHLARVDASYSKDRLFKRDATTGLYQLTAAGKKIQLSTNGPLGATIEYTNDNTTTRMHGHVNNEIIPTDDMVTWFNPAGSKYRYPNTADWNPATFTNTTSSLPFFPDYGDGTRDFTNAYNARGLIRYRFTCSTCHNPHGSPYISGNTAGGNAYPDLRLQRQTPNDLCVTCHK